MKSQTLNNRLMKLLPEGYIVYIPSANGYDIRSFKADKRVLNKIKVLADGEIKCGICNEDLICGNPQCTEHTHLF